MTFKHVKFEDSPTMRALEKVAKEKGLVKPETLQKQASVSKTADYTPSNDLLENILKLCSGLRAQGLKEVAAELETKFLNYKQAQTLYETSTEKGEDLINAAHPKGSHKLENVDGDEAVVENVLDIHDKLLEMVNKKPTGKLSNAKQIIKEVKRVLAQDASGLSEISSLANAAYAKVYSIVTEANAELTFSATVFANDFHAKISVPTVYNLDEAKTIIKHLYKRLNPSFVTGGSLGAGGVSAYTWERLQGRFNDAISLLDQAIEKRKAYDTSQLGESESVGESSKTIQLKEVTPEDSALGPLYRRIGLLKQKLQSYKLIGSISRNTSAVAWIDDEINGLNELINRMKQVPENMENEMSKQLAPEVTSFEKDIAAFAAQWTQPR